MMMPNENATTPLREIHSQPSLAARLAAYFRERPGTWIDGRTLSTIAGSYAWRTRISDVRRAPFNLSIVNRQRRISENGRTFTVSEYIFIGERVSIEGPANDASTSNRLPLELRS